MVMKPSWLFGLSMLLVVLLVAYFLYWLWAFFGAILCAQGALSECAP